MSETLEEKVKSLSSNIEKLTKSVDQLNVPDTGHTHYVCATGCSRHFSFTFVHSQPLTVIQRVLPY